MTHYLLHIGEHMKKGLLAIVVGAALLATNMSSARELDQILESGTLKVGTTGDYKPFSFNNEGTYEGFDIAMAKKFAEELGVELELVPTTWPTLVEDLHADKYDIGMSGITRTTVRQKQARFSQGYLLFGKTPLVHKDNASKFKSLSDLDNDSVKVGVNPGGTNQKFVDANIQNAEVVVYENNLDIPQAVANKEVDIMITDSVEALYYAATNENLEAPLAGIPFTQAELGYLMQSTSPHLQDTVNFMMDNMKIKGEMTALKKEYLKIEE